MRRDERDTWEILLPSGYYHIVTKCSGNTFHFQLNHLYGNKVSRAVMWLPMELITCFLFNPETLWDMQIFECNINWSKKIWPWKSGQPELMFIYPKTPLFGNNVAMRRKAETWFYHTIMDKMLRCPEESLKNINVSKINRKELVKRRVSIDYGFLLMVCGISKWGWKAQCSL